MLGRRNPFRSEPIRDGGHAGYYSLDERGGEPDYEGWDARLDRIERSLEPERDTRWYHPSHYAGRSAFWWAVRILSALIMLFVLLVGYLAITAPLNKSLEPIVPPQITLLAADGTPIARKGAVVDEPVDVEKLPAHVIEPFLAIEDRRFYDHWGVDPRGIARAAVTGVGGGSTITQQLAKFTFLTPERSMTRKMREMLIAFWLEGWLTKDEILERYLSNAYFGDNTYGLRAASLHFFYRQPENLKPEQAAMLAGLLQAPSAYNPSKHYSRAEQRMRLVVQSMVAAGYITESQAASMRAPQLDIRLNTEIPTGTYFADWALPQAREETELGYDRRTLTTTLDARLQAAARRAVARAPLGNAQVALVAMRPNGEVVAMIGGKDYAKSPFNRATQAKRQPGSTFKTFVYLAALENGWSPDDRIDNTAFTQGSYRPKNARERYSDSLTLEQAFASSSNVAAVRLMQEVGSANVIETARELGIDAPMTRGDPSLALGTSNMTLLELTSAFAGIASNAYPIEPYAFPKEEARWWESLMDRKARHSRRTHDEIEQMLRAVVEDGTGTAARLRVPAYGKTGTSQDNRDAVFVGYTRDLVVGVWVGNDDNAPLPGNTGGGVPARIWRDFMTAALGVGAAPPPAQQPQNPAGPVEPQDVPTEADIPIGDVGRLRIREGAITVTTDVDGVPIDFDLDTNGVRIDSQQIEEARRRAEERAIEAQERAIEELERAGQR